MNNDQQFEVVETSGGERVLFYANAPGQLRPIERLVKITPQNLSLYQSTREHLRDAEEIEDRVKKLESKLDDWQGQAGEAHERAVANVIEIAHLSSEFAHDLAVGNQFLEGGAQDYADSTGKIASQSGGLMPTLRDLIDTAQAGW